MSQISTADSQAIASDSRAEARNDATILRKLLRKFSSPLIHPLQRLAASLGIRWQPEFAFRQAVVDRRQRINRSLYARSNGVVMDGPFAGMKLSAAVCWGDGDLGAKLLGCYEQELHCEIEEFVKVDYQLAIVIGCAEGYYAVGLGRRMPKASVVAFEISPQGQQICKANAALNELGLRLSVRGECTVLALNEILADADSALLFVDCEGAEKILLDPQAIPCLAKCDFVVECHDFLARGITETLIGRFSRTHEVVKLTEGARDSNSHRLLAGLSGIDRALAICECRPERMHWLVARHRSVRTVPKETVEV